MEHLISPCRVRLMSKRRRPPANGCADRKGRLDSHGIGHGEDGARRKLADRALRNACSRRHYVLEDFTRDQKVVLPDFFRRIRASNCVAVKERSGSRVFGQTAGVLIGIAGVDSADTADGGSQRQSPKLHLGRARQSAFVRRAACRPIIGPPWGAGWIGRTR